MFDIFYINSIPPTVENFLSRGHEEKNNNNLLSEVNQSTSTPTSSTSFGENKNVVTIPSTNPVKTNATKDSQPIKPKNSSQQCASPNQRSLSKSNIKSGKPVINKDTKISQPTNSKPSKKSAIDHQPIHREINTETSSFLNAFESSGQPSLENQSKLLWEQNEKILAQNAELMEALRNSVEQNTSLKNNLYQPLQGFPFKTIEEFYDFSSANNEDKILHMHNHLIQIGGSKLREFLNYSLKQLMTDNLVTQFSWPGSSNTEKFGDTKISNLLYESAKNVIASWDPPIKLNSK
ncbi:uncharacterized protein LOC122503268 [Leptopilina heterotoma]|uniref:uncharacterized protein LOC122503268 n=1 Tax=Leptopilina heterotoma TaxID=63436 RepID=UPI001CA82E34|nr:uncharacterized protein LOC122503268 [Leptopilina heterotoma]